MGNTRKSIIDESLHNGNECRLMNDGQDADPGSAGGVLGLTSRGGVKGGGS